MAGIGKNAKHVETALDLFTDQFRDKTNVAGVTTSIVNGVQALEDAIWETLTERLLVDESGTVIADVPATPEGAGNITLEDATNAQLDTIGALVGEERLNRSDPQYAAAIRLRNRANQSNGKPNDLQTIAVLGATAPGVEIDYNEVWPAGVNISIIPLETGNEVGRLLEDAAPAGVAVTLIYSPDTTGETIRWGSSVGTASRGYGFADTADTITNLAAAVADLGSG